MSVFPRTLMRAVSGWVAQVLDHAGDHPLIALALVVFVAIPLVNGWMHEARFFGECAIVGVRFFKHEMRAWRELLGRFRHEFSTWDDVESLRTPGPRSIERSSLSQGKLEVPDDDNSGLERRVHH